MTRANQEHRAVMSLKRLGIEGYSPRINTPYFIHGRKHFRIARLFPRYLFADIRREYQWDLLRNAWGILCLVTVSDRYATLRREVIWEMKRHENAHGIFQLPTPPRERWVLGTQIMVTSGPLRHLTGLYDGMDAMDRECILLEVLGRKISVTMAERHMLAERPATQPIKPTEPRPWWRRRGRHGRRVHSSEPTSALVQA